MDKGLLHRVHPVPVVGKPGPGNVAFCPQRNELPEHPGDDLLLEEGMVRIEPQDEANLEHRAGPECSVDNPLSFLVVHRQGLFDEDC